MMWQSKGQPRIIVLPGRLEHRSARTSRRRPAVRRGICPVVMPLEARELLSVTPTSISLSVSNSSLIYGQKETITATVTTNPPSSVTPTGGQVVFMDGTTVLGSGQNLVNGTAQLSGISLSVGTHVLTGVYGGTGTFGTSTTSTSPQSIINTVAGGDAGALATSSALSNPQDIVVDTAGDIFIADFGHNVIREVDHSTHIISTYAGNGYPGTPGSPNGDNGLATSAELNQPSAIALNSSGDLFIADTGDNEIREVNEATGIITTVAGNGTAGSTGDANFQGNSGIPTDAELNGPEGVAVDPQGEIFIADTGNNVVREIMGGKIWLVAGTYTGGYNGEAGAFDTIELSGPADVAVDSTGNSVYIADTNNDLIRVVDRANNYSLTTIAGTPQNAGFGGDGKAAASAILDLPGGLALDGSGDLYIADLGNNRIREVTPGADGLLSDGIINTVAGTGQSSYNGDGGPATSANLYLPGGVAVDSSGDLYIADSVNNRIRMVNSSLIISTVAGDGDSDYGGDNGPATQAALDHPFGIAVDRSGDIFIADSYNNRIREVNHANGQITTIAGDGAAAYSGDGGPAIDATLNFPVDLALNAAGTDLYIADTGNNVIRTLNLSNMVITTVAGNSQGTAGYSGDNGPAITAELNSPFGVALDSSGNLFIADTANNVIREVIESANTAAALGLGVGDIITVAGNGHAGYAGDGGLPTKAELNSPYGVVVDSSGNLFIADTFNNVIREVNGGAITTYAGIQGLSGYYGDGGLATQAGLNVPNGVALDASGNLYIADAANDVIREVNRQTHFISTVVGNGTDPGFAGDGAIARYASMYYPDYVTVDGSGDIFIADARNDRIREVQSMTQSQTVTVGKAALTVTAAMLSKPYGAAIPQLTYAITGFIDGDNSSVVSGAASITTSANAFSHVSGSPYVIQIGLGTLSATGYTFDFVNGSLNVTPVPLTIAANNATKVYGSADPTLTASSTGFVDGDSMSSLIAQPSLSTTANSASHVEAGGYPITASGAFRPGLHHQLSACQPDRQPRPADGQGERRDQDLWFGCPAPDRLDQRVRQRRRPGRGLRRADARDRGDGRQRCRRLPDRDRRGIAQCRRLCLPRSRIGRKQPDRQPRPVDDRREPADLGRRLFDSGPFRLLQRIRQRRYAGKPEHTAERHHSGDRVQRPGAYPILVSGASSPNYTINDVGGTLTVLPALSTIQGVSIQKIVVGRHKTEQVIVLFVSGVLNVGDADNPGNYNLVTIARGKKRSKGVAISRASYNSATNTVTLTTAKKLTLNPPLRLSVNAGGLLDNLGRPLDGNGQPGGNFVTILP